MFLGEVSDLSFKIKGYFYVESGMGLREPLILNERLKFGRDNNTNNLNAIHYTFLFTYKPLKYYKTIKITLK